MKTATKQKLSVVGMTSQFVGFMLTDKESSLSGPLRRGEMVKITEVMHLEKETTYTAWRYSLDLMDILRGYQLQATDFRGADNRRMFVAGYGKKPFLVKFESEQQAELKAKEYNQEVYQELTYLTLNEKQAYNYCQENQIDFISKYL